MLITLKSKLLRNLVVPFYCLSLKKAKKVIFQNKDNHLDFIQRGISNHNNSVIVPGSGVNLKKFKFTEITNFFEFLCIGRLLKSKGILEFLKVAKSVKSQYKFARFVLVGPFEKGADSISESLIADYHSKGIITYRGEVQDVRPFLRSCGVFVLPSYHEGLPRSILEAMATGRPIISCDVPGCRDTVVEGVNGFLVEAGNTNELKKDNLFYQEY